MRTTLDIDEDVLRTAEERARATGQSPGKVISEMARRAFELDYVERLPRKNGFPQLPFDPRIVVTPELIDELLDENEGSNVKGQVSRERRMSPALDA